MTLVRPVALVTVDGRSFSTAELALAEVLVENGTGGLIDRATLSLSSFSPQLDVAPDAQVTVAMGAAGDEADVFTGLVVESRRGPTGTVVEALGTAVRLAGTRIGRAYLDQTVADIAADLIGSGGADVGDLDAPMVLPAYHVSEHRTVWRHLQELSRLSTTQLRCGADGAVHLTPVRAGRASVSLRFGAELLGWSAGATRPMAPALAVVPSGAGSEAGADRWQLPLAEPDGGAPEPATEVPSAIRTRDAARTRQDGLEAAAARRSRIGWVTSTGVPDVRAGDLIELVDVPGAAGEWHVLEAHHAIDRRGMQSRLRLEAAS